MNWSWLRSVVELTREPPASDEDRRAWAEDRAATTAVYGFACAVVLNLLHLVFWPTDRFLLFPSEEIGEAVRWLRLTSFTWHTILALLLLAPALRRRSPWVCVLGCVVSSALLGHALGRMGPIEQPYIHLSYVVPLVLNMVLLPLPLRVLVTPLPAVAVLGAYLATRPSELHSPVLGWTLGCMTLAVATGIGYGHLIFLLARRAFLQDKALQRQAAELRGHRTLLEEQVAEQTSQLRRLAAHLEQATEGERARLSRELHDELGQQLTGLRYSLASVQRQSETVPADAQARLVEMGETLSQLTSAVREIVTDLRPQVLDERGLGAAVAWLVERTEVRTGLPCTLEATIDDHTIVDAPIAIAAFRIIQESLTNVARHAHARHARIVLGVDRAGVRVVVQDDGVGLSGQPTAGMGLLGMRERARAHGGRLTLTSGPGGGTELCATFPLSPAGAT
jgi:signal transduction histidine kinase